MKPIKEVIKRCEVIEGTSKKTGKPYQVIELELVNGYKELVFLSRPMSELIKLLRV